MSSGFELSARVRKNVGSADSKKLRDGGEIPAIIYGGEEDNVSVALPAKEFCIEYFKGGINSRVANVDVDGKIVKLIPHRVDVHPVTDAPVHVDFVRVKDGVLSKVRVDVKFHGREKSPGLKKGGFLNVVRRKIELWCDPSNIPQEIEINVSKMHMGDAVKADDVSWPEGVKTVVRRNFTIATITGRGKSMEDDDTTAEGGEGEGEGEGEDGAAGGEAGAAEGGKEGEGTPEGKEEKTAE